MKVKMRVFLIGLVAIVGVLAAFATGDADGASDDPADNVFLGELDLAEQMEIWRNQYRRMTPGNEPLVQDIGTWPAAWEEFGPAWSVAPAERDLATWLVPVVSERTGSLTVLRDTDGNALWSGATDFAKNGSESVSLTGALVSEEDWSLWQASRAEIDRRLGLMREESPGGGMRGGPYTNGLRFTHIWAETNGDFRLDLAWESNGEVQVFCRAMHSTSWVETVVYTNDENEVVTNDVTKWRQLDTFMGRPDAWEVLGVATVTNGEASFTDTNIAPGYNRVRFYAAAKLEDTDNDGLTDGEEWLIVGSSATNADSDFDGIGDLEECTMGLNPMEPDSGGDWLDELMALASGEPPPTSNAWWTAITATNLQYQQFLGCEDSWSDIPQTNRVWTLSTTSPWPEAIVKDVAIDGFVDDVITIDGTGVVWQCGTHSFTQQSVTNEIGDLQSGQFSLALLDWPNLPDGGCNEVRLGDTNGHAFRVEWKWGKPFDVQMEPIWTDFHALPLENPSGIVLESNAWFHVEVWPDGLVPETNIAWTSIYHKVEILQPNVGARIQVHAIEAGADELVVSVDGVEGDLGLPPFHVQVKPLTVVTAVVGVVELVEGTNHFAAVQADRIANAISNANNLLQQACLQIEWDGTVQPLVDPGDESYWNVVSGSPGISNLCASLSCPGGLEIYFVHTIAAAQSTNAAGLFTTNGILVSSTGAIRTLAHEIGHACGAKDAYVDSWDGLTLLGGCVSEQRMPQDWGMYRGSVDWSPAQSAIVPRLLMFGLSTSLKGDIPSGDVYGLRRRQGNDGEEWYGGLAPVGLSAMTNTPVSY